MAPKKKPKPIIAKDRENRFLEAASSVKKESKEIDFKEKFDPASSQEWCQIIKDIIAMANSGGGVIIFGVKDDAEIDPNFDKALILGIDPATIADKIYAYTTENFSDVKIIELPRGDASAGAFLISPAPTPIAFTKAGSDVVDGGKQKPAFVKGSVYFRHGAKSEPGNTNDIRRAIDHVVNRNKKTWFEGVRKISNIKDGDEVIVSKSKMEGQKVLHPVPGRIVSDKSAPTFRPDNAAAIWPHRSKELLKKINEILPEGNKMTSHDLTCIKRKYKLDEQTNPDLIYKPYKEVSPRYSDAFITWISDTFKENPKVFEEAKTYYKDQKTK